MTATTIPERKSDLGHEKLSSPVIMA